MNKQNYDAPHDQYFYLWELISFKDFDYSRDKFREHERTILQPQLEAFGYTDIRWEMGEYDDFGPLTRVCKAKNPEGEIVRFVYG